MTRLSGRSASPAAASPRRLDDPGRGGAATRVRRYAYAFDALLLPLFRLYDPELIIVSAGFDSARGDPLGGCDLTPRGYARLLHRLKALRPSRGIALCLEGGYNCISVARSYAACVGALLGADAPDDADLGPPSLRALRAVVDTAQFVSPYWPGLRDASKKCQTTYAEAFKAELERRANAPEPQQAAPREAGSPGAGWAFPAFPSGDGPGGRY